MDFNPWQNSVSANSGSSEPQQIVEIATRSAFFYGTLIHPRVLRRVLGHAGTNLKIAPALLEGWVRHRVRGADFPAIISAKDSHDFFKTEADPASECVRGSYVTGLTFDDMKRLDRFESGYYELEVVEVTPLADLVSLGDLDIKTLVDPGLLKMTGGEQRAKVRVVTYAWSEPLSELEKEPWSFEDFVTQKLDV